MSKKGYVTIPELAKNLGVSRIAVYNHVKKGEIAAQKAGKIYIITDKTVTNILGKEMTTRSKKLIDKAVHRTVREYGDVLKKLSGE
jgi:excisionase family DNA binding protein